MRRPQHSIVRVYHKTKVHNAPVHNKFTSYQFGKTSGLQASGRPQVVVRLQALAKQSCLITEDGKSTSVFSLYGQISQGRMADFPAFIASKSFDL